MSRKLLGIVISCIVIVAVVIVLIFRFSGDAPPPKAVQSKPDVSADAPVAKPTIEEKPSASADAPASQQAFVAISGLPSLAEAMAEKSIGSADAPVTMIEYASLTCSHCAAFHNETLPSIKRDYVDTGKVRIVFRDFPLGNLAMAAAMVARCSGQNYVPLVGALFQSQASWARSDTPFDAISGIARLSGMSVDDVEDCLDNKELLAALQAKAQEANQVLGVESTPTFFVGDIKIPGNLPYEDFQDILNKALAAKQ